MKDRLNPQKPLRGLVHGDNPVCSVQALLQTAAVGAKLRHRSAAFSTNVPQFPKSRNADFQLAQRLPSAGAEADRIAPAGSQKSPLREIVRRQPTTISAAVTGSCGSFHVGRR